MNSTQLTKLNFYESINNGKDISIIDFYADWCGPCKIISPIFDDIASNLKDHANFYKFNIEEDKSILEKYKISSVPTILILKEGIAVDSLVGFLPANKLESKILEYI